MIVYPAKTAKQDLAETISGAQLLVLGMHRSGTSAITGALRLCGAWVGEEAELTGANTENPRGFWERRDTRKICDRLLHTAGVDWWSISQFVVGDIPHDVLTEERKKFWMIVSSLNEHGTWALKEPRLCFLLPVFRNCVTKPICIHIYRNPLEVSRSLRHRNGFGIAAGLALWEAYNRSALSVSENLPRVLVSYEALALHPLETLEKLLENIAQFTASHLVMPDEFRLKQFIDPSLYRCRADDQETLEYLSPSQLELWEHYRTGQAVNREQRANIPRVARQHLLDLQVAQASHYRQRERERELTAELNLQWTKNQTLEIKIKDRENTIKDNQTIIKRQERTIDNHQITIINQKKSITARDKLLDSRDTTIRNLMGSTSWRVTAPLRALSRAVSWFSRNLRRAGKLLYWLCTGQFTRALVALLPYYRKYIPRFIDERIPEKFRRLIASRVHHLSVARSQAKQHFQEPETSPIVTYIVPSAWCGQHPAAAQSLIDSGQLVTVIGSSEALFGSNVTVVSGTHAKNLALSAVATETVIEIDVNAPPDPHFWSNLRERSASDEWRLPKAVRLWSANALSRELAAHIARSTL